MDEINSARHYLKWVISEEQPERIAFVGPSRNEDNCHVINYAKRFCKVVHVYDRDPRLGMDTWDKQGVDFTYCTADVIFEKCDLSKYDLIVVLSQEKMFPVPKRHKGNYILLFGLKPNNGNCTTDWNDCGIEIEENYVFKKHRVIVGST